MPGAWVQRAQGFVLNRLGQATRAKLFCRNANEPPAPQRAAALGAWGLGGLRDGEADEGAVRTRDSREAQASAQELRGGLILFAWILPAREGVQCQWRGTGTPADPWDWGAHV